MAGPKTNAFGPPFQLCKIDSRLPDCAPPQRSVRGELLVQKLNVYEPAFKTRMIGLASAAPPLIQRSLIGGNHREEFHEDEDNNVD